MQETPPDKLLPILVEQLQSGTELSSSWRRRRWPTPAPSAARTTSASTRMMALSPGLPDGRASCPPSATAAAGAQGALPQHQPHPGERRPEDRGPPPGRARPSRRQAAPGGEALRDAVRRKDATDGRSDASPHSRSGIRRRCASTTCCRGAGRTPRSTASCCLYRAWDLLDLVGREHAHTLLRQSVRYCVKAETRTAMRRGTRPRASCCRSCWTSTTCSAGTPGTPHGRRRAGWTR